MSVSAMGGVQIWLTWLQMCLWLLCVTFDGHMCATLVGPRCNTFLAITNLMQYSTSSRHWWRHIEFVVTVFDCRQSVLESAKTWAFWYFLLGITQNVPRFCHDHTWTRTEACMSLLSVLVHLCSSKLVLVYVYNIVNLWPQGVVRRHEW